MARATTRDDDAWPARDRIHPKVTVDAVCIKAQAPRDNRRIGNRSEMLREKGAQVSVTMAGDNTRRLGADAVPKAMVRNLEYARRSQRKAIPPRPRDIARPRQKRGRTPYRWREWSQVPDRLPDGMNMVGKLGEVARHESPRCDHNAVRRYLLALHPHCGFIRVERHRPNPRMDLHAFFSGPGSQCAQHFPALCVAGRVAEIAIYDSRPLGKRRTICAVPPSNRESASLYCGQAVRLKSTGFEGTRGPNKHPCLVPQGSRQSTIPCFPPHKSLPHFVAIKMVCPIVRTDELGNVGGRRIGMRQVPPFKNRRLPAALLQLLRGRQTEDAPADNDHRFCHETLLHHPPNPQHPAMGRPFETPAPTHAAAHGVCHLFRVCNTGESSETNKRNMAPARCPKDARKGARKRADSGLILAWHPLPKRTDSPMIYPAALAIISIFVAVLERLRPWRPAQQQIRPALGADILHLLFNGHFLGIILYGIAVNRVLPHIDAALSDHGWTGLVYRNTASSWSLVAQTIVALFVVDFVQWCVHNALHRIGPLWNWHKVHHSVKNGEMDWIVSFRFQWTEVVFYKAILYLPLAWFGFAEEALLFHAIFGTLVGHFNHANLDIDWGIGKYILNSPRMHIWHHDYDAEPPAYNFGIIFSIWDWVFRTAYLPPHPPARLGYEGVEDMPADFFGQQAWQLGDWVPALRRSPAPLSVAGAGILSLGWVLHSAPPQDTSMMGETMAASQPTANAGDSFTPATPAEAAQNLQHLGKAAAASGYKHPEWMTTAEELGAALTADKLVILDIRPNDRVEAGRIPSSQAIDRKDYSVSTPAPGVSADVATLQALLRSKGVDDGDTVVLYGDGGPEPYRLWWTLRTVAGFDTRILDGGLAAWKAQGLPVAGGMPLQVEAGNITLHPQPVRTALLWTDLAALQAQHPGLQLIDTRSLAEFTGDEQHKNAARAGRIPEAKWLEWDAILRDPTNDPRLLPVDALTALLAPLYAEAGIVTYCQSGTRSAGVYFAMAQLGWDEAKMWNYDGSWAEYSLLTELPIETGPLAKATP